MPKKVRSVLSVFLLLLALAAAIYYLSVHHSLLRQLVRTPLPVTLAVFGLYILMFAVLVIKLGATIRICRKRFAAGENSTLNSHILLINFFAPGQGGPAYLGVYLYKRHKLKVKNYIAASLLYYVFYAMISVFFLLVGSRPWWQTIVAIILTSAASLLAISWYARRSKLHASDLDLSRANVLYLFGVTLLQAVVQAVIYLVELHSVSRGISLTQVITYTGAANLALFAALTPGAIGIRESFLIFTERLHHISSANIIVANVIDRSVYIIFLLGLIAWTIGMHAQGKLQLKRLPTMIKQSFKLSYKS